MNENLNSILKVGGRFYYSAAYPESDQSYDAPTDTNMKDNILDIEAQNVFTRLFAFQNFNSTHAQEDERTTAYDDCDLPSTVSARLTPSFNIDLFGTADLNAVSTFLDTAIQVGAGAPVASQIQTFAINTPYGTFSKIAGQNFDGSAPTINSLTEQNTAYALILGTDYDLIQDASGEYGIVFINSGNYDLTTNAVDLDYGYTPAVETCVGYRSEAKVRRNHLLKFESCPEEIMKGGVKYTRTWEAYLVGAFLNSEYVNTFVDLANNDVQSATVTFTADKNIGDWYFKENLVPA